MDLSSVFTPDSIMPLLSDPEFREQLAPFLPAGEELPQSPTELSNTLRSPQFQQVLYDNGMVCGQPLTPEHQVIFYTLGADKNNMSNNLEPLNPLTSRSNLSFSLLSTIQFLEC